MAVGGCSRRGSGIESGPDAGQTSNPLRRNRKIGTSANQHIFEASHKIDGAESLSQSGRDICRIASVAAKVENRIADDLSRSVKGDVAAAVAFKNLDSALGEQFRRGDYIRTFCVAPKSDDRFVLKQQKHVANFFIFAQCDQLLLQAQTGCVIDAAELDD